MDKALKIAHPSHWLFGVIPGHILLSILAKRATDVQGFARLVQSKYVSVC